MSLGYNEHLKVALTNSMNDIKHKLASGVCKEIDQVNKYVGNHEFAEALSRSLDNLLKEYEDRNDNRTIPASAPIHTINPEA